MSPTELGCDDGLVLVRGRGDRGGDDDNAAEEGGEDPGTNARRTL